MASAKELADFYTELAKNDNGYKRIDTRGVTVEYSKFPSPNLNSDMSKYKVNPPTSKTIIIDNLEWKEEDEQGKHTWHEAITLCKDGWRLPTIQELLSIVDYSEYDLATSLPNMKSSLYWSASPHANGSGYAWFVNFDYGGSNYYGKNDSGYVRLVRDVEEDK